jgi:tungstate transport system ATP-binding protein
MAVQLQTQPILALRDIQVVYESGRMALDLAALDIGAGCVYAVVGANGAGKSTLFKVLTFLVEPQRGRVLWQGQDVLRTLSPTQLRQRVVWVSQTPLLFRTSVFQNVAYGLKRRRVPRRDISRRVVAALDRVHMADATSRSARHLSGGETQRVALARALVLDPEVLLLDEPTANLDAQSCAIVEDVLQALRGERTVLFTTHDLAQAYRLSDEVIALEAGRLADRPVENVLRGTLVKAGQTTFFVTKSLRVVLPGCPLTASCIAIAPEDIVLSTEPLTSSARNGFAGSIIQARALGTQLDILVDVGERLHARITQQSFDTLGLTIGRAVYVTFKASAVQVYA